MRLPCFLFLLVCCVYGYGQPVLAHSNSRFSDKTNLCSPVCCFGPANDYSLCNFSRNTSLPVEDTAMAAGAIKNVPLPFQPNQLLVPGVLALTGIVTTTLFQDQIKLKIVSERNKYLAGFHTSLDNYLQYAPVPIAYGLDLAGIPSKNDLLNRSLMLLKGEALMFVSINILKHTTKELRPDGSNAYSFPSGHTAQAFTAATFLAEEYKDRLPWMPYAAYGLAGTTALLRIANNKHYIGDVLMGAALGILSMKIAYWTHQYKWGKHKSRVASLYE